MIAVVVAAVIASLVTAALTVWITYQISLARVKATYLPTPMESPTLPTADDLKTRKALHKAAVTCLCSHSESSHSKYGTRACYYDCYCARFESQLPTKQAAKIRKELGL